jgi:hypothetical protein
MVKSFISQGTCIKEENMPRKGKRLSLQLGRIVKVLFIAFMDLDSTTTSEESKEEGLM